MRPVDRVVIVFNAVFAVLWAAGVGRSPYAAVFLGGHVMAAGLAWLIGRQDAGRTPFGRAVRTLYPVILAAAFWFEVGAVRVAFHGTAFDGLVLGAERVALGFHPHAAWIRAMPSRWISEPMFLAYVLYYPLVFFTPFILYARRHVALDALVLRIAVVYFACYVSYAAFPVDGPLFHGAPYVGPASRGIIYRLVAGGTAGGDALGAAFPSSHVAGSVAVALFGWTFLRRSTAWALTVVAVGVAVSAIYTGRHYAADVVAGTLLAVVAHYGVAPLLERWLGGPTASPQTGVPVVREHSIG